ncbi:MAG: hypothetical protein JXB25_08565 [Deltaproteobacteria bacterium]|nr:hypothetical protein [Deltaproteobacteria bacterium]
MRSQPGRTATGKTILLPLLLALCCPLSPFPATAAPESARQIRDQVERLQQVADHLEMLHRQLQINKDEVFRLHERAVDNLQGNALKVYLKGGMEIYNKVTAPLNSALDLLVEVYLNLKLEPKLWTIAEDRVALLDLSHQAARENARLALLYTSLSDVMQQDAERFDDDLPPLRHTTAWWGKPDDRDDPEIERVTRKLKIVKELSHVVYKKTDAEMARVREERRQVLAQITKRTPELNRHQAEEQKLAAEMAAWQASQQRRQAAQQRSFDGDGRGAGPGEDFASDRPPLDGSGETPAERIARLEKERAAQAKLDRDRREREKGAIVYVDSECPRTYAEGDTGTFLARIEPDGVEGYLVWKLDDRIIGKGPTLRYTFFKTGLYDLSVDLTTQWGRFTDRYVDQVRVDPAPAKPLPPAYPPAMEGQRTVALDLPFCKYWTRYEGGKIVLTGHYFTATGQKVDYTSQPITNFSPAYPAAGMFALADGTGFHVYQTEKKRDEAEAGAIFVVTRMKGEKVETLHRLPVTGFFQMTPAPDNRSWTVTYTEQAGGAKKKVVLR